MTFPTDFSIAPAELGRAAEDADFETLLFAEHTHIPVARDTPNPRGGELPEKYWHTHDPFVALATVAQATTKLRLGTGICLVVERDPITTAKEVASLDFLSGGRFDFGVGGGWNREEMRNHGTDPRKRFAVMRERILAMKEIWTKDEPEFHGEYVDFDPLWAWPKPVQDPHPPVLVGGLGKTVLERVLEYGDEWMPNRAEPEELAPRIADLRERAGRHVPVSYYAATPEDAFIERLAEAGVDRALLDVPSEGARKCCRWWSGMPSLPRDIAEERLSLARSGRLATVTPAGRPHVIPVCFALDGGRIVIAVDQKPKRTRALARLDNVRATGRASLLVDHYEEDWSRLWWVRVDGAAEVIESEPAIDVLAEKYAQYRTARPAGPVIAIAPDRWRSWIPSEL